MTGLQTLAQLRSIYLICIISYLSNLYHKLMCTKLNVTLPLGLDSTKILEKSKTTCYCSLNNRLDPATVTLALGMRFCPIRDISVRLVHSGTKTQSAGPVIVSDQPSWDLSSGTALYQEAFPGHFELSSVAWCLGGAGRNGVRTRDAREAGDGE